MLSIQTANGEHRSSTAFILSMVFRHALKLIKNETGKSIQSLQIKFDGFNPNEVLKDTFEKAGKLSKTNILFCWFVFSRLCFSNYCFFFSFEL